MLSEHTLSLRIVSTGGATGSPGGKQRDDAPLAR